MRTPDPTAARTIADCGCRCHVNADLGCDPAHDTGSSGVAGQPSCAPHALADPSSAAEQLEAAVHHDADALLTDVEFLADHWADLGEHRRTGTRRSWRQALLDPDTRARAQARDAEERAERDPDAPGFTAAPMQVDVLDVAVDTWVTLDELAALLKPEHHDSWAGGAAAPSTTDIAPQLAVIRARIRAALPTIPAHRVNSIGRRLHHAVTEVSRVLALVRAGQLLTGAICPWCHGVTPKHPEGGHTTMRVEELPGSVARGLSAVPAVVCWNTLCDPPHDAVGAWMRGRPAWTIYEWDWLAPQLIVAEPQCSAPRPPPSRPAGFGDTPVLPIERFAGVGTSRTAPDAHRADTSVDALIGRDEGYTPAVRAQFIGGPFAKKWRSFLRPADTIAVITPLDGPGAGRPALAPDTTTQPRIGNYTYARVNDQPAYVWSA